MHPDFGIILAPISLSSNSANELSSFFKTRFQIALNYLPFKLHFTQQFPESDMLTSKLSYVLFPFAKLSSHLTAPVKPALSLASIPLLKEDFLDCFRSLVASALCSFSPLSMLYLNGFCSCPSLLFDCTCK